MPQPSVLIVRLSSVISLVKVQVVTVVFGRPAQVPRVSSWRSFSSRTVFLCASSTRSARTASAPALRASWWVQLFFDDSARQTYTYTGAHARAVCTTRSSQRHPRSYQPVRADGVLQLRGTRPQIEDRLSVRTSGAHPRRSLCTRQVHSYLLCRI